MPFLDSLCAFSLVAVVFLKAIHIEVQLEVVFDHCSVSTESATSRERQEEGYREIVSKKYDVRKE